MNEELPIPYKNYEEYKEDLRRVFEEDYGVIFSDEALEKASRGIEKMLEAFL